MQFVHRVRTATVRGHSRDCAASLLKASALAAVVALAGLSAEARTTSDDFKFSEWEAWNAFKEGSSVTMEMEVSGMKMVMVTACKKKEETKITVETVTEISGDKLPGQERVIEKPKDEKAGGEDAKCRKCGKPAKDHIKVKQTKEKVKVGDKELECALVESTVNDCGGNEAGSSKSWFSKDVPGFMVKMEAKSGGGETKMRCTAFDAKK